MIMRAKYLPIAICFVALLTVNSSAQTSERRQTNPATQAETQSLDTGPTGSVANEISLLRKSLQSLNTRLREINDKLLAVDSKPGDPSTEKQNRISTGLDLLTRAEQRAEVMRKQLIELIEKETSFRTRIVQIEEEIRPDNIERSMAAIGTTRTMEMRDVRRRVLENERRGVDSLLNQTYQSRVRLEEDVKQADALVSRIRQRILPLIEKEIDKINPN